MMQNKNLLLEEDVLLHCKCRSKEEVMDCLAELLRKNHGIGNTERLKEEIWKRERMGYTGLGNHIALAHGESELVNEIVTACISLEEYVDWAPGESYPELYKMVKLVFLFVVPKEETCQGTGMLKDMVLKLGRKECVQDLMNAKDSYGAIQIFKKV
jgi:PTS system fructose-specific IIA component